MPSTEYDDYTFNDNDDFDTNSNVSFYKVEKRGQKNKVSIGNNNGDDDDDDFIYNSGNTGSFICNAVTGYKTNFKVGSPEEDYFFSVIDSSGRYERNKNPVVFFFESPEQYERIMKRHHPDFNLSQTAIQNWHKKQMSLNKSNKSTRI